MSLVQPLLAAGVRRGQGRAQGQLRGKAAVIKPAVTILFSGVAMLAMAGCGEKNAYVAPPPPKVVVAQPLQQPVTRYIELTGNTQAINSVDLEARVQGFLEKINYTDGSLVKKGDVLFVIQQNTYQAQLEQAKATLASNLSGLHASAHSNSCPYCEWEANCLSAALAILKIPHPPVESDYAFPLACSLDSRYLLHFSSRGPPSI